MRKYLLFVLLFIAVVSVHAQTDRWQQKIKYLINVNMNVQTNRFTGSEKIDYWNNSPDTLNRIFFHLYWNAFQPGSMMDVRSRELGKILLGTNKKGENVYDWDDRVKDRISKLQPDELGFDSVKTIKINSVSQKLIYHETILEVDLDKPILPHTKISMDVAFESQVPLQIRRSGRDNAEGVRYSMSQWYPKVVEYDYQGWNANPYIAREFYGVWGDYDVNITIDKTYLVAASGTIQNPNEVGFGYQADNVKIKAPVGNTITWKFSAQNIHDFVWAADPGYVMQKRQIKNGPLIYVIYKQVDSLEAKWTGVADSAVAAYPFIAKTFGAYPYKNYSFIQGGDGGMEYPMATLIKNASIGTAIHEWMHSWYQGMMGTNESLFAWMDEGFTTYAELRTTAWLKKNDTGFAYKEAYNSYLRLVKSGREEPMTTHSDHFNTNMAYSAAAYSKGSIFLSQLGYIVGDNVLDKILLEYYNEWRFKHPNANDFVRVAEKVSGMELDWYKEYWIYSTKTIDYAVGDVTDDNGKAKITIKRIGLMPMPVDVLITYKDGTKEMHYIPLNMMYGAKPAEDNTPRIIHNEWKWVDPEYNFTLSKGVGEIKQIEIDPSMRLADVNRINNKIVVP
ncbi:M1 family metallopeptidase [Panacibacter ginsenosidivorans]|uniref:M1 family metallopeptidase n=1 Tax=Panacibacter ginsenosidivorans TaxID=1813871 RepID=A0A5B8V7D8_9BACT|nr:M1 family metallopeptidase [Panacibacter ginsenosidivorans]QEC67430.1 M1 family metallopeptidase [Panacibacter ginsenosidivorans]